MSELAVVILAAGKGTRMKSDLVKVLHPVAGSPMLSYPLDLSRSLKPSRLLVVVGFQADLVQEKFKAKDTTFVLQKEQLGTGHAVLAAKPALRGFRGSVLILSGDVPLLTEETVSRFLKAHQARQAALSVMTVELENPKGYGRVFRNADGSLLRITEDKDLKAGRGKGPGDQHRHLLRGCRLSLFRPVPCDPPERAEGILPYRYRRPSEFGEEKSLSVPGGRFAGSHGNQHPGGAGQS